MKLFKWMAAAFIAAATLLPVANAEIRIRIDTGTQKPLPIAVPDFGGNDPVSRQIADVVRADLESTGLFQIVPQEDFIQKDLNIGLQPRFPAWKVLKTEALVVGDATRLDDGRIQVAFRLWDIYAGEVMRIDGKAGRQFTTTATNWRRVAHKISDSIYSRLTGEDGYFDTRIVYIAESGPATNRKKRLAIMDADGANHRYLTPGFDTILTPRFSTSDQEITYMSMNFENFKRPQVYLFNIETGRQEALGNFKEMTFAPRFSYDGNSVLLSEAKSGNTDLYVMDLRSRQSRRLTDHPAIDTSPSMSPDGSQVVFNSDRGGSPQLYIMNTDGSPLACPDGGRDTACRITYGKGRYTTPVWSPRGDLIAFTKQNRGKFHIGVIRTNGKDERLLTESYQDEGPAWSPNGRVLTFFRYDRPGAGPKLMSVDLTGRNLKSIPTPTDASDPAWSPLLD